MFLWLLVIFVSAVMGSFLNVVIYRLPLMLSGGQKISLCFPASFCPHCGNTLKKRHNIPVLSYLYYRGKCAWCGNNISLRYPMVELLVIFLAIVGKLRFSSDYYLFIGYSIVTVFSVVAAFIDLDTKKIPDALTWPLLITGVIFNVSSGFATLEESVCGAIFVFAAFHFFSGAMEWVCTTPAIGGGDIKYFTSIAAWFGLGCMPFIIFSASLMTLITILIVKSLSGTNISGMKIPFAPGISASVLLYSLVVYADPFNIAIFPFFI